MKNKRMSLKIVVILAAFIVCALVISQLLTAKEKNGLAGYVANYLGANKNGNISANRSELSYEDRLQCQRAIEEVYWQYRIWPKENPNPKPSLDKVMTEAELRGKVSDIYQKSNALDYYWNKALTGRQLQEEIQRMAQHTKYPEMLQDLWNALDNDPYLIAECMARPILVDKNIRELYASDKRFHGNMSTQAQTELQKMTVLSDMKFMSGIYWEKEYILGQKEIISNSENSNQDMILSQNEWNKLLKKLYKDITNQEFDTTAQTLLINELPVRKLSPIREDANRFYVAVALSKESNRIKIAKVEWKKHSFEEWWGNVKSRFPFTINEPKHDYILPPIVFAESWTATTTTDAPEGRADHTAVWTGSEMIIWGGTYYDDDPPGPVILQTGGRYNPSTDSWTATTTTGAPAERLNYTAVWTGTEMIVWGGGNYYNTGGKYYPTSNSWTATSTVNAPEGRRWHSAVWTGSKMIIWGGEELDDGPLDTGGLYTPGTDSWTETNTDNAPSARYCHSAVWTGSKMIVWGGDDWSEDYINTGGKYDPIANSWSATTTTNAPTGRAFHGAVWSGSEMIIWGGCSKYCGTIYNTGGRYDPAIDSWSATTTTNAPTARGGHTTVWASTQMIIWGGAQIDIFDTGGRYNPSTDSWTETTTTGAPMERVGHVAVWTGTEMIVWGGYNQWCVDDPPGDPCENYDYEYTKTGGRYNPGTEDWSATSTTNAPDARADHTTLWTGSEMIVWGGYDGSSTINTGGKYNPSTDSWSATTTSSAPTARRYHTTVWTGTNMIVWGGYDGSSCLDSGSKYNPSSNSWTATTTTSVPSARFYHTAVWKGSEMIVWGGYDCSSDVKTGGRYNESSNNWTATKSRGISVTERERHTAIWTGSVMIIWGGYNGSLFNPFLAEGWEYDPSADDWTALSTTNQPGFRYAHTAVWTGSEMIVWGGSNGSRLNSGGRYNQGLGEWYTTSTTNAPSARDHHTAVWTGSEMIIWGGYDGTNRVNTGGRYDPLEPTINTWVATTTTDAPSARERHGAVWTGAKMVIWGGYSGSSYLDTGGIYEY